MVALRSPLALPARLVSPPPLRRRSQRRNEFHPSAARPRAYRARELADAILARAMRTHSLRLPPPGHLLLKAQATLPHLPAARRAPACRWPSADTGLETDTDRVRPRAYAAAAHDAFTAARPRKGTDRARGSSGQRRPRTACWRVGASVTPVSGRGVASKSSLARTGSASAGAGARRSWLHLQQSSQKVKRTRHDRLPAGPDRGRHRSSTCSAMGQ